MWDEITYPFPNVNDATNEIWEWICNSISHQWTFEQLSIQWYKLIHVSKRPLDNKDNIFNAKCMISIGLCFKEKYG